MAAPKSQGLRAVDVRSLVLLVGECRELGDDRHRWRRHFTERLARLAGAEFGIQGEMTGCASGRNIDLGNVFWSSDGGAPPTPWVDHLTQFRADPTYSPTISVYHERTRADLGRALSRTEFIADRDWYGSHDQELCRLLDGDAALWCFRPIPHAAGDDSSGLVLIRSKGRRDFGPRDRAIVHEAHAAIAPMIGGPLARFVDPSPMDLSPAKRRVLACLLQGDSEKQIAARLRLSAYTVNEYTQAIYRHFGIQSRAELLAHWIRRARNVPFSWLEAD